MSTTRNKTTSPPPRRARQPHLTVIVPAYNEGQHIYTNLLAVCKTLDGRAFEVIVVDDGSQDNTLAECQRAARRGYPIRVIRQDVNRGKGASLIRGFEAADGDLIAFLDADLEIAPQNLLHFGDVMQAAEADVVAGVKDPSANRFPLVRRLMSMLYRAGIGFLFGLSISDTQTGIKLFKRAVLEAAIPRLKVSRFAFDVELLVAASRFGYRIVEHPVEVVYRRASGLGRIGARQVLATFWDTLAIYYRASFWRWLEPDLRTRLWMVVFVLSVFLAGIGIGKLLTPVILSPPFSSIVYYIFLQFLPTRLRDWLLAVGGALLVFISLVQLNKILLDAFARRDRGDLAGILRK